MSRISNRPDSVSINLTRLLTRLERVLLSPEANPHLCSSSYTRTKVGANLEHARSLLLRLEHDSASIKIQSRKQSIQADLQSKRELIKQLNQRLYELNQLDDTSDHDSVSEDEPTIPSYAPAVPHISGGLDSEQGPSHDSSLHAGAADLSSTLRARHTQGSHDNKDTGISTGSSLFPAKPLPPVVDPKTAQAETLLSHNRTQQEDLTSSLLSMAQQLKAQTVQFGASIESEKAILDRATEGLDKNTTGMEAAGQRMSTLRRMTEGRGLVGRIFLYVSIACLWILTLLLVLTPAPTKDLIAIVGIIVLFLGYGLWRVIDGKLPWGLS